MTYLVMLRTDISPDNFESTASDNADLMKEISERGRAAGAIHHAFYEVDGQVWVVDEWDNPDNFQRFFESEQEHIGPLMAQAGASGPPAPPQVGRRLDTADAF